MKSILKVMSAAVLLIAAVQANAQDAVKLRINEIMLNNESNYTDEFGKRSAWVEIFNPSYATVNIAGCYLTDDPNNPTKYFIQKGDVLTQIKPRQHVVFFMDKTPDHGTFHTNFTAEKRYVALFDANGKTLIDELTIPEMDVDVSYGRLVDGGPDLGVLPNTTPSTNNLAPDTNVANERFMANDRTGIGMSITAMTVVFLALALLFMVFLYVGKFYVSSAKKRAIKSAEAAGEEIPASLDVESGEVYAAIAMALYEYQNDIHDLEHTILTIEKISRAYSPWSSKIYGLRQLPQLKK
ncbi:MAG: lamin tail domain-containing protein [Prevotellaceae bacterium]|nr:lamin tail domain-containing protein [Prevotellaceae bacterium]